MTENASDEPSRSPSAIPTAEPTPSTAPTASPTPTPRVTPAPTPSADRPSLAALVGQKLIIRMTGTTPTAALLDRIRLGQIGGVILFGSNVESADQVAALTRQLQATAREGGRPPLLISTDQEGGPIMRIPWAPPTLSPPEMGALGSTTTAHDQGVLTGAALLDLGINCNLAPVADVPVSTDSFMQQEGRTWSFDPALTSSLSNAFARGLRSAGVVPVMKHFPGIGLATLDTDTNVVILSDPAAAFEPGLLPYEAAVDHGLPVVMLSNATYPAYDAVNGAGWSPAIVKTLLRARLGFQGVTMTDSLSGTAKARGVPTADLAIAAAIAGTDMILVTGPEDATARIYDAILAAARDGRIARATLADSYARIIELKARM
jgi:beta-N-acetylhexosaminidase